MSEPLSPLLQAEGLDVHFAIAGGLLRRTVGQVQAVSDVNLALYAGEVLGVVGESGCGKTTLARALAGLLPATRGRVRVNGQDLETLDAVQRRNMARQVQMVFQDPVASLNPRHRVRRILEAPFDIHGLPSGAVREQRLAELLQMVGLDAGHLECYPHEFSGGQRQRIGIARALALQPRVVILDEPLSALDMSIQSQVLNLLVGLQQKLGLSYLFVSHDLGVVQYLCDTVAVMYLGRIVETAPAVALFAQPLHPYTQSLLAAVPAPDPRQRTTQPPLQGDVPSPSRPPPGCAFHTRCSRAVARCREERPLLRAALPGSPGQQAACHLI